MKFRQLGACGITVSEIGLGTWELAGDAWGSKDNAEYLSAIYAALDAGITYFDTALEYGNGNSERILGEALRGKHSEVIISTKVPPRCGEWSLALHRGIDDFFPGDWIRQCCEQSLRNLQREYIDVLLLHTWSHSWAHCTAWYEAMIDLKRADKIRTIGISVGDHRASEANAHIEAGRLDAVMTVFNIFEQEPEYTLIPLAQKHGVGVIARCPFSSGVLTGTWHRGMVFPKGDWRAIWPGKEWKDEQLNMLELVRPILDQWGEDAAVAALKFILNNPGVSSAIPGSSRAQHIHTNASASNSIEMPTRVTVALRQLWMSGKIHGVYNGA